MNHRLNQELLRGIISFLIDIIPRETGRLCEEFYRYGRSGRMTSRSAETQRPKFAAWLRRPIDSTFVGRPLRRGGSTNSGGSNFACHSRTNRADHRGPRVPGMRVTGGKVSGQTHKRL